MRPSGSSLLSLALAEAQSSVFSDRPACHAFPACTSGILRQPSPITAAGPPRNGENLGTGFRFIESGRIISEQQAFPGSPFWAR